MSEQPALRVWEAIAAADWAILPERLPIIFDIAARLHDTDVEAVAKQLGRPLNNERAATRRDGVMVIPIEGVIFPRASLFTAISGGVSVNDLALDLQAALDAPDIHSIVLVVDSPGGDINGVGELAAMVREATKQKRVSAYVRSLGASAAYWIVAAADEIVAAPTALIGSIGVVTTVGAGARRGSGGGEIDFVSSQSPHKRIDPTTGQGVARIQRRVDAVADVFIGDVARYRGITREQVIADFGGGDVLVGQQAVDAGLADRLGSFEGVVAALTERAREPRRIEGGGRFAAQSTEGIMAEQGKQGFWSKFWGHLGAQMDADEAFTPAVAASGGGAATHASATVYTGELLVAGPDPETVALRAELARLKGAERLTIPTKAQAWAEGEVKAGRAYPAEMDALVTAYTDAAGDDLDYPRAAGQPSRVASLDARQAARPAHALTGELVPVRPTEGGGLQVLTNQQATKLEGAEPEWSPTRWRDLCAYTPTGRAILAEIGVPQSGALTPAHEAAIHLYTGNRKTA